MIPKTSKLGTSLSFRIIDMRGQKGFPRGAKGLCYEYLEQRMIRCKNTGLIITRDARYALRTDHTNKGFRIDLLPRIGPAEAVYGLGEGRPSYWATAKEAASALVGVLNEIEHNSSL